MTIHHTLPAEAEVHETGWAPLDDAWEVTKVALVDTKHSLPDGTPLFARLNYDELLEVAKRYGAEMLTGADVELLRKVGVQLTPYLGTPIAENDIVHSERHDANIWQQLRALDWDGNKPVIGDGKYWIAGAPPGRSRLMGADKDGAGPGLEWWQGDMIAHNRLHFDDMTTGKLKRRRNRAATLEDAIAVVQPIIDAVIDPLERVAELVGYVDEDLPVLKLGDEGRYVEKWQRLIGVTADGAFGPNAQAATKKFQTVHGLVPDGVVGEKSWAVALEGNAPDTVPAPPPSGQELPATRTPITAATLFSGLSRVLPDFSRDSLLLLVAMSSHETNAWKAAWNFSLGNEKAQPGWLGAYCYRYCDEGLSPAQARAAIANAKPRRDGGGLDAAIKSTRTDGQVMCDFWPNNPQTRFRAFTTLEEAIEGWLRVLRLPRYRAAWAALERADLAAFSDELHKGGYYTAAPATYVHAMRLRLAQVTPQVP